MLFYLKRQGEEPTEISLTERNDFSPVWDYTNKADLNCLYTAEGIIKGSLAARDGTPQQLQRLE